MTKTLYQSDAEKMRESLGPSLCLAKWNQVSLHLTTGQNNSCYHPPLHKISQDEIRSDPAALHNTNFKKDQRKLMLKNERPTECNYCWTQEDLGNLSDRHYRSSESWAAKDLDFIKNATGDENIIPSYVEVNFNSACNLKCSYCSPQFSSSWADEIQRHGGYPTQPEHNAKVHFVGRNRPIPAKDHNPYLETFWQWWPTLYPELEHFRMTGGEPLMDKNTYRVFDYVLENPSPKLHMNVTSNFSVEDSLFEKYLEYVKKLTTNEPRYLEHFMQYVSLDAMFERAEYARHGLDFELLWHRVNRFLTEVPTRSSLTFIITMNNLNVTGFHELVNGIHGLRQIYSNDRQRIWFDTPVLEQPYFLNLHILPEEYIDRLEEAWSFMCAKMETPDNPFKGFKDYELNKLQRVIDYANNRKVRKPEAIDLMRGNFYKFCTEHDKRRDTDFLKTFPEMKDFWENCRYHAHGRN